MLRRDLLKGIFATTMLSAIPSFIRNKKSSHGQQHKLNIHFVGLGGAGCNTVEYAMTKKSNAQFTFINQKTNRDIPENVNFIDLSNFKSNPYYSGFAMSPEEFYEMDEVVNVFEAKYCIYTFCWTRWCYW